MMRKLKQKNFFLFGFMVKFTVVFDVMNWYRYLHVLRHAQLKIYSYAALVLLSFHSFSTIL